MKALSMMEPFVSLILIVLVTGCGSSSKAVESSGEVQSSTSKAVESSKEVQSSSSMALQSASIDLGKQLSSSLSSAGTALGSITDVESAKVAVPQLESVNAKLDEISAGSANMSPTEKASLSEMAASQVPMLKSAMDQAYAIPGVKEVIQPPMDSMLAKLAGL